MIHALAKRRSLLASIVVGLLMREGTSAAPAASTSAQSFTIAGTSTVSPVGASTSARSFTIAGTSTMTPVTQTRVDATITNLTSGSSTTDGVAFTSASISPTSGRIVHAAILAMRTSASIPTPTLVGNGLTWTLINTQSFSSGSRALFTFLGTGTPSAGTNVMSFGVTTLQSCIWSFSEIANAASSGHVVQTVSGTSASSTGITTTLAALESATNLHICAVGMSTTASATPSGSFVELSDTSVASNNGTLEVSALVNTLAATPTYSTAAVGQISTEIKSA